MTWFIFVLGVMVGIGLTFYCQYVWGSYVQTREARRFRKQLDEGGVGLFLGEGGDSAGKK